MYGMLTLSCPERGHVCEGNVGKSPSRWALLRAYKWAIKFGLVTTQIHQIRKFYWLVLSDEQMSQMSKGWPFFLLNDEQMSNWLGVEHQPVYE